MDSSGCLETLADILRAKGTGPVIKWVDDPVFFRVPKHLIPTYNKYREQKREAIVSNGGILQSRGRLWYKGEMFDEAGAEPFAEGMSTPIKHIKDRENGGIIFLCDIAEIDEVSGPLGVPWESSKDIPFSTAVPFTGLPRDPAEKRVAPPDLKKHKHVDAILEWRNKPTHTLEETQKNPGPSNILPRSVTG